MICDDANTSAFKIETEHFHGPICKTIQHYNNININITYMR